MDYMCEFVSICVCTSVVMVARSFQQSDKLETF